MKMFLPLRHNPARGVHWLCQAIQIGWDVNNDCCIENVTIRVHKNEWSDMCYPQTCFSELAL